MRLHVFDVALRVPFRGLTRRSGVVMARVIKATCRLNQSASTSQLLMS